jgi:AraC-like DNA-binding protein
VIAGYSLLDYWVFPAFSVFALSIGVLSVYRPELWFKPEPTPDAPDGLADTAVAQTAYETANETANTEAAEPKERYLALDPSLAQTLAQQLTQLMEQQQLYRQSELSLPGLAAALNISVHHLSELLNVHVGKSFYELLNEYRLAQVCRMLSDPACQLRVLDIAFEAGFNNKNSFNRVFKEHLNLTPTQYRVAALKPQAA